MMRMILPVMRIFTSSKTYGSVEFMMSIMIMDVLGDLQGKESLKNYFIKNI